MPVSFVPVSDLAGEFGVSRARFTTRRRCHNERSAGVALEPIPFADGVEFKQLLIRDAVERLVDDRRPGGLRLHTDCLRSRFSCGLLPWASALNGSWCSGTGRLQLRSLKQQIRRWW